MGVLEIILIIFEVIASLALIVIVLFQSGKEAGLSGALTGGAETYLGKGKGANLDKKLASATKWISLAWILLTLCLAILALL